MVFSVLYDGPSHIFKHLTVKNSKGWKRLLIIHTKLLCDHSETQKPIKVGAWRELVSVRKRSTTGKCKFSDDKRSLADCTYKPQNMICSLSCGRHQIEVPEIIQSAEIAG
jgi:hypothetical protein